MNFFERHAERLDRVLAGGERLQLGTVGNHCKGTLFRSGRHLWTAALEARSAGRSVVLIEKNQSLGGSTAWSVGSVTATQTPHQLRKGITDCPEDHWRDMAGFNGDLDPRDNPALRRILADAMPDTFRWLLGHGIRFYGPMPEPPHTQPRMHNVLPNSRSFIVHLERAARRAGVDIRRATRAQELIVENGRVVGVRCADSYGTRHRGHRSAIVVGIHWGYRRDRGSPAGDSQNSRRGVSPARSDRLCPAQLPLEIRARPDATRNRIGSAVRPAHWAPVRRDTRHGLGRPQGVRSPVSCAACTSIQDTCRSANDRDQVQTTALRTRGRCDSPARFIPWPRR